MIDGFIAQKAQDILNPWHARFIQSGLKPTVLIIVSFVFGLVACFCAAFQAYIPAIIFLILNRAFDSIFVFLDGETNSKNAYKKSVFDMVVFGGFVFFFSMGMTNASLAAACLMFAYLLRCICSQQASQKTNIIENSEIVIFMVLCCLFPHGFAAIAIIFAILCVVDAIKRFYDGIRG